jgi:hypothetical protein
MRTSRPSAISSRAQWCADPEASSPTRQGGSGAKNSSSLLRLIALATTTRPEASTQWT